MLKKTVIGITSFALLSGFMLAGAGVAIQKNSVSMATDEINTAGGINGKKIEPIMADTKGKPDAGRRAIEKLITRDKVLLIGGGFSSSVTWATISIAQQKKIAFLVNSASADKITEQDRDYIFRLNQPVSEHLEATDIKSVAIVHANSLKSSSDARKFFKKSGALRLKMVIKESFETGVDDFRPLLTRVKAKNPDLLYAVTDDMSDAALLTRHSKELNLNPMLFAGGAIGFALPEFAKNAGIASNYVACMTQWTTSVPYPGAKEYHTKFKAKYDTAPTYHGAQAYAAIYVSYNKKSRQNRLPTYLIQWIDGKAEIVWPKNMATNKYVYPRP
jgi:branched-chain amino acid transport system substrate-binding protein